MAEPEDAAPTSQPEAASPSTPEVPPKRGAPEVPSKGGVPEEGVSPAELRPEFGLVRDVELRLTVEVGATKMAVGEVMQLEAGAVVELDRNVGDPADLLVNGTVIGRAEVTVEDGRLAIRVVELGPAKTRDS